VPDLPEDLRAALYAGLTGVAVDPLRRSVERLIEAYRSGTTPKSPILANSADAAAYAAYRMPATYSAVAAALAGLPPRYRPETLLDLGGGTGAAAWAVATAYPEIAGITIADQAESALAQGAALALGAAAPVLRGAAWRRWVLGEPVPAAADLVTVSYVLGELTAAGRETLLTAAVEATTARGALVIVEPGTPAGYDRVLSARSRLIAAGWQIAAPCPHQADCPLVRGDWCHFGVRVNRSALHRRLKEADLSYEDEKFSYLVATPEPVPQVGARVLRRPAQRKGLVSLRLCRPDGTAAEQIVTKRLGADVYKAARDVEWGDAWPFAGGS
jgi:ribosomal protein RSM22 (predicted rRNA methylase)